MYYGGTTSIVFDNSVNGGIMCEFADSNANPLCDTPTTAYYFSGAVIQGTTSTAPDSLTATTSLFCPGTSSGLSVNKKFRDLAQTGTGIPAHAVRNAEGSRSEIIVSPSLTTTFYARAEGTCNTTFCDSIALIVETNPVQADSITSVPKMICSGDSASLILNGGSPGTDGNWFWYSGSCGGSLIGSNSSLELNPAVTGIYYARAEGICSTSSCISFAVNFTQIPLQPAAISGNINPLSGSIETYSVSNASGISYSWSAPSGWTGMSTTNSVTYTIGYPFGVIAVTPYNSCGSGTPESLQVGGHTVSGYFYYDDSLDIPLDSVQVYLLLNGNKIDSVQADVNGFYSFSDKPNSTYTISASTHKPWNGANATDALKVKRHFAGSEYFTTSLKLHAADANLSNTINITDAVKIIRRFVGSDTSFERGNWVFEKPVGGDTLNVSPGLNDTVIVNYSDVSEDFKGLCVGDVNGSYVPLPGTKSSSKISLDYSGIINLKPDESFELPLIATRDQVVSAISLIIKYPKELVQIFNVKCAMDNVQFSMGNDQCTKCNDQFSMNNERNNFVYHVKENELRIGWLENDQAFQLKNNETFIIISGKTSGNFQPGDVIKFEVANNPLCEMADETATPVKNVRLQTFIIKHSGSPEISNNLNTPENYFEIYPNPAKDKLNIRYQITHGEKVRITVFNMPGKEINVVTDKYYLKGIYDLEIDLSSFPPGVYTCRMLTYNNEIVIKKFVVSK